MKKILFLLLTILINNFVSAQWINKDPTSSAIGNAAKLSSVFFTSANTGYVVGVDSGRGLLLKTTDGGASWSRNAAINQYDLHCVFFLDADTGFVSGKETFGRAVFLKTTDGGNSWNLISTISDYYTPMYNLHFVNSLTGFTSYSGGAGGKGTVYKTIDGGISWNRIWHSNDNDAGFGVHFITPDIGYMVRGHICAAIVKTTNGGDVWRTQHGGIVWNNKPNLSFNPLNDVYLIDSNTAWAVGDTGMILNTTNGYNWYQQTSGTTEKLNDVFFINANTGIAVGNNGTILKTNNGGQQWIAQNGLSTSNFKSVHFVDANIGHCTGENKTVRRTIDGGGTPLGIKNINKIELTIFPNPSTGSVLINSKIKIEDIRLESLLGQTLLFQKINADNASIDLSNFPDGQYRLIVNTLDGTVLKKIVLQK